MSSSTQLPKFLLDENVRIELFNFLKRKGIDVKLPPKSATDSFVASLSKREQRVLVTNDEDFCEYSKDKVYSVVWLRLSQNDSEGLIKSFEKLLGSFKKFPGRLVVLKRGKWGEFPLGEKIE